jgi:hypothetical protein
MLNKNKMTDQEIIRLVENFPMKEWKKRYSDVDYERFYYIRQKTFEFHLYKNYLRIYPNLCIRNNNRLNKLFLMLKNIKEQQQKEKNEFELREKLKQTFKS